MINRWPVDKINNNYYSDIFIACNIIQMKVNIDDRILVAIIYKGTYLFIILNFELQFFYNV